MVLKAAKEQTRDQRQLRVRRPPMHLHLIVPFDEKFPVASPRLVHITLFY